MCTQVCERVPVHANMQVCAVCERVCVSTCVQVCVRGCSGSQRLAHRHWSQQLFLFTRLFCPRWSPLPPFPSGKQMRQTHPAGAGCLLLTGRAFESFLGPLALCCQCPAHVDTGPGRRGTSSLRPCPVLSSWSSESLGPSVQGRGGLQQVVPFVYASSCCPPPPCCFTMHCPGVSFLVYSPG